MKKLYFLTALLLCCYFSFAQTKGLIYKPASTAEGKAILDPNNDGYTSKTTAGFKSNDRGSGESEINYKAIPILDNEPIQDPLRGPGCGFTDMVDSGIGDPVMFYFDGVNFLVRFRLNKTSPNSKGYSVLIDTDQKFGFNGPNADPNAIAGNPGFEMELVLKSNHGIGLYNVDGTNSPALIVNKDYESHSQKSIAYTEECGDMDYFYDFYIPWSDFGLPVDTKLRMAALTVMSPHPATGNNAKSDVGGVDDRKYGGNYDQLFQDFIENFNPTSPQDNNAGLNARTLCPAVDGNIVVTTTTITGTSTEAAGTTITVYKNGMSFGSKAYVASNGTWSLAVTGLSEGDVITASAKATGKEESESNCSGALVGQTCSRPAVPVLSGSNGNSNKFIKITVSTSGTLNLYLGSQTLVSNFAVTAGTTYYYCPSAGITTASNGCNGGNNLTAGMYRATIATGGCISNSAFLCVNTTTASAIPVVNSPITTLTKDITGTATANAQVILKINGAEKVRIFATATGSWSIPASSLGLVNADKISAYALEDGKCQSSETDQITVTQPVSFAPAITGTYCGTATVVTGTSSEAAATTIKLFIGSSATPVATTTTNASGNWSISGLSIAPGATLTAKATATGKAESAASTEVAVKAISSNAGITIKGTTDPATSEVYILESATAISGTSPASSGIISLYLDEMLIGTGTVAGGVWTVKKSDFPNDFYLFAGANLTATYTADASCESDQTAVTVAIRCAPPTDKIVTPDNLTLCTGATPEIKVAATEAFLIYQLYNGNTPISSSLLGTGADIILKPASPLTTTEPNTVLNLRVVASKIAYVKGVNCELALTNQVAVTLNPVIENNTISLSGSGAEFCGTTKVGAITGSTPTGGDGVYTYLWQKSTDNTTWVDITEAIEKDYNPGDVATTTYYRRKVFSGACANEDASASVKITILAAVANNLTYNGQSSFCGNGTPTQIEGNTDAAFTSYKWQSSLDGTTFNDIDGATSANYTPGNLTKTTTFRRVVSNGTCESFSANITITINPAVADNIITAPAATILCVQGNVGEIKGSTPTGGDGTYTYKWQKSTDNGLTFTDITPAVTTQNYTPGNVTSTTHFRRLVTSAACANAESNVVKITVASVAKTTITADASMLAADGSSTTTIKVQLKDDFNTDVTSDACALNLTADKGTISNVEYAGNGTYTATYTSGTVAGLATITGMLGGTAITDNAQITLEPAVKLAATIVSASPASLYADGVSTALATVAFKDHEGSAILVDAAKVQILLNGAAVTELTDKGNGEFTVVIPARSAATTVTVTAKYNGVAAGGSATVEFIPVPVVVPTPSLTASTVTANPAQVNADGVSTATAAVQFKKADGSNLEVDATKVQLLFDNVPVAHTNKGNGLFEAIIPARTSAAQVNITATYDGASLSQTAKVEFIPAVKLAATTIVASPTTVNADGTSTSIVTLTFKDYAGNSIAIDPAKVDILLGGTSVTVQAGTTGVFTATVPARTVAATVIATATYNGTAVSGNATVSFIPVMNPGATVVSASPATVGADGTSTSTAQVAFKDYAGNAIVVDDAKVQLLLDGNTVTITPKGNGVYEATVPARTIAQTVTVTTKYNNTLAASSATVKFVPALNLAATELTATPAIVDANGVSTATAKVVFKDYAGNPIVVDASKVEILLDGTATTESAGATGTFTAVVPARTVAATVAVTANYNSVSTGGNATVKYIPALNLAATTVVANPATVNADGVSTSKATVTFKDYAGNAIEIETAKVAILLDGIATAVTAKGNGVFEAMVPARKAAEIAKVTASYDATLVSSSASVEFVPALELAASIVIASPVKVNADGISTATARVEFKDYAGNAITVDASKVSLLANATIIAGLQDKGNGVFEAIVPARTIAATVEVTARYNTTTVNDKAEVEFVPAVDLAATTVVASPVTVNADGKSTATATVTFKDYAGNPIAVELAKVSILLDGASAIVSAGTTGVFTATVPARTTTKVVEVTAKYNSTGINDKATVEFVPAINLAATVVSAAPATVNADGVSTAIAKLEFKDYAGNPAAVDAAKVELFLDGTAAALTASTTGVYTATVPARTNAETVSVTAAYNGTTLNGNATVEFVPAVNLAATVLDASPKIVNANGTSTSTVTLQFKDYAGNPIAVDASKVSILLDGVVATKSPKGTGEFTATVPARKVAETVHVSATYNSTALSQSTSVKFIPVVEIAATQITASPTKVNADGTSTSLATITFRDYAGNGFDVDANKLQVLLNGTAYPATAKGSGVYEVIIPARVIAETVKVTANYNNSILAGSASVEFVPALNLAATTLSATPSILYANGTSTALAKLSFFDYNGNPIAVYASKVKILLNGTSALVEPGTTGIFTAAIPARLVAEKIEVTTSYDDNLLTNKETVEFIQVPVVVPTPSLAKSTVTASPVQVSADGVSTAVASVQFKDEDGADLIVDGANVEIFFDSEPVTFTSKGNGLFEATLPARVIAETVQVTAKYNGAQLNDDASVKFVPAVKLAATVISATPTTVNADGRSTATATVTFKDYAGNTIEVDPAKVAILLNGTAGITTAKGNGIYETTIPASTTAATVKVTANYNNAALTGSASVEFIPALDLTATVVTAVPATVNADGVSTATAKVEFKDYAGNPIAVDAAKVELLLDGATAALTASATGVYTATVPARKVAAEVKVTATYNNVNINSSATVNFVPVVDLAATQITASPVEVTADGVSTSLATIQFKDHAGNAIAVDAGKVTLLFDGDVVAIEPGGTGAFTATVSARTTITTVTITAKYNATALNGKATVEFVPVIDLAATVVSADPATVNADGKSTATASVQFNDKAGDPINVDPAKVVILLNGKAATATAKGNGLFEAAIPARTIAEKVTVTATYDGTPIISSASVNFIPAVDLASTVVSATPEKVNADGVSTSLATVAFRDYAGNAISVNASDVELLFNGAAVVTTDRGDGVFEATVPARVIAETVDVTAKYNSTLVTDNATVEFIPALDLTATTITAGPTIVNADGTSTSAITITFKDYAGNPIVIDAAELEVLLNGTGVTFRPGTDGVFTAVVPARKIAEAVEITAKYNGATVNDKATVTFIPALNLAATVVTANPTVVKADGTSTATAKVEFMDHAGNPIVVDAAKVVLFIDGIEVTAADKGNGEFEATVPARTTAATVEVTAKYDGTTVADKATVEFTHVPVLSLQLSTVVANPTTVVADGTSASLITVQLKDTDGNNFVTTDAVTIGSDFGTVSVFTANGNGNYTATITSANIGLATITAKVGANDLKAKPTVNFVIGAASGTTSTIVASVPSIPADGVSTSVITVTLFDAQNRRITTGGDDVALATTLGTLGTITDNNNGTYTATLTAGTTAGTAVVSGTVNSAAISSTASVVFTALPLPNRAPVAVNDAFTVNNHEKLTGNVLTNDTDPDGDQLTVKTALAGQPMFGTVVMQANGNFTYTPNKGYTGEDSFTYEVCDNESPAMCTQATVVIQVKQAQVFIPEGFSPDGDGENDTFVIYGAEQYKVSLKVFNRWGDIVYENKIYRNDWDGTAKKGLVLGDKLPDGTYFYVVDLNNGEKPKTHSLIIKRK